MDVRLKQAVAVGRFGSFSKAAAAVGVTQSAVTKSVAELERRLGFPIFHRTSRGVVPTDEGRVFLERALRLLTDAEELLGHNRPFGSCDGLLRIGVFPSTIEWLLAAPLAALLARHPGIRLDITTGTKERGIVLLERGDVDVALGLESGFSDRAQFQCEHVTTITPIAFVRQGHPALASRDNSGGAAREEPHDDSGNARDDADLHRFPVILPSEIWDLSSIPVLLETYGVERIDWFHKIENFSLVCKVVESTDAIGLVDSAFAATRYFQSRFATLDNFRMPPSRVCCATRERWTPKPAAAALIETLKQIHNGTVPRSDIDNRLAAHEA